MSITDHLHSAIFWPICWYPFIPGLGEGRHERGGGVCGRVCEVPPPPQKKNQDPATHDLLIHLSNYNKFATTLIELGLC